MSAVEELRDVFGPTAYVSRFESKRVEGGQGARCAFCPRLAHVIDSRRYEQDCIYLAGDVYVTVPGDPDYTGEEPYDYGDSLLCLDDHHELLSARNAAALAKSSGEFPRLRRVG